jgi:hypothetical protein
MLLKLLSRADVHELTSVVMISDCGDSWPNCPEMVLQKAPTAMLFSAPTNHSPTESRF